MEKKKICPYCGKENRPNEEDENTYYCDQCDHEYDEDDE